MMADDIIEAEIVESSEDTVETETVTEPKRVDSDKRRQILFWGTIYHYCLRSGFPAFILGLMASLVFGILYSESHSAFQFVMLIISLSIAGLGLLAFLLGFLSRRIMVHYMKQDPNYEEQARGL